MELLLDGATLLELGFCVELLSGAIEELLSASLLLAVGIEEEPGRGSLLEEPLLEEPPQAASTIPKETIVVRKAILVLFFIRSFLSCIMHYGREIDSFTLAL